MLIAMPYLLAGALTGFMMGLTGVGGGTLMTPLLVLLLGVAPVTAVATDLWFSALTKLLAAGVYLRKRHVDWSVAGRLWAGSLPMALGLVLLLVLGGHVAKFHWLNRAIGGAVLLTALGLLLPRRAPAEAVASLAVITRPWWRRHLTSLAGALLGLLVAVTSIGAGAIGCVLLRALYPQRLTTQRLIATDVVHSIPLALLSGVGYLWIGAVNGPMLCSLLLGSVPAMVCGGLLAKKTPERGLRFLLGLVLLLVGVRTLA